VFPPVARQHLGTRPCKRLARAWAARPGSSSTVTKVADAGNASTIARAPSPYEVPISAIRPVGLEATRTASNRCTSGIEYAPAVTDQL